MNERDALQQEVDHFTEMSGIRFGYKIVQVSPTEAVVEVSAFEDENRVVIGYTYCENRIDLDEAFALIYELQEEEPDELVEAIQMKASALLVAVGWGWYRGTPNNNTEAWLATHKAERRALSVAA